jgi:ABC-type branched-subunit amino acid transport system substrate-binding protein
MAIMVFASCDGGEMDVLRPGAPVASPTSSDARVIGLVGTLSGPEAWRGEDAFEGADLAISELNQEVDEGRPRYELVTRDDGGNPGIATQLVQQLASIDRTVGIIYAGPPEALPAAEAALTQAGIPAILLYGDLYSARLLRPHIFQSSPPLLWQARAMARYIERDRGYRRIGVLVSRSPTADTALVSLRTAFREQDIRRLRVFRYDDVVQVPDRLRRLKKARVEALVVGGSGASFAEALTILRQRGQSYLTTRKARSKGSGRGRWNPQVFGFDSAIAPGQTTRLDKGTIAADSYSRGPHLLPIPSLQRFHAAFTEWWDGDEPLGWELRAYDAVHMIGWASKNSSPGADLALVLEHLRKERFGGLTITLGPDDHTIVEQATVGLWVVPRGAFEPPSNVLPWLPLARGFSIDGERTAAANEDWRYLFRNPPPPDGPAPKVTRMRYAVNSPRSDPIH